MIEAQIERDPFIEEPARLKIGDEDHMMQSEDIAELAAAMLKLPQQDPVFIKNRNITLAVMRLIV